MAKTRLIGVWTPTRRDAAAARFGNTPSSTTASASTTQIAAYFSRIRCVRSKEKTSSATKMHSATANQ